MGQGQGGLNPMALAMMLRKKDPTKPAPITDYSEIMPDTVQTNSLDR
jgi:hypothetical protein